MVQAVVSLRVRPVARSGAADGRQRRTQAPQGTRAVCEAACRGVRGRCVPFAAGEGVHRLWGTALFSHASLGVNLLGGSRPHIGAVAVATPRRSLARPGRRSATTSVLALPGHKDDELARFMATELARELGMTVVVTAGVHLAGARASDIAAVLRTAGDAVKAIRALAASVRAEKRRGR